MHLIYFPGGGGWGGGGGGGGFSEFQVTGMKSHALDLLKEYFHYLVVLSHFLVVCYKILLLNLTEGTAHSA